MMAVQLYELFGSTFFAQWFEGRAAAESRKTLTWRYMMKVEPFGGQGHPHQQEHAEKHVVKEHATEEERKKEEQYAEEQFWQKIQALREASKFVKEIDEADEKITGRMRDIRAQEWGDRRESYRLNRLNDQIDWYRGKSKYNSRRAKIFQGLTIGAEVIALGNAVLLLVVACRRMPSDGWVCNVVTIFTTVTAWFIAKLPHNVVQFFTTATAWLVVKLAAWFIAKLPHNVVQFFTMAKHWYIDNRPHNFVPFLTTFAASFIAWAQAKRFDELKESYHRASEELCQIEKEMVTPARTPGDFVEGVMNAEEAVSREHTMWAAKSPSVAWRLKDIFDDTPP